MSAGSARDYVRPLLLLCAVLGDTHLHHSQLKPYCFEFAAVKHNGFGIFYLQDPSGLLGASWVPPGCLLGASWVPPGYLLAEVISAS